MGKAYSKAPGPGCVEAPGSVEAAGQGDAEIAIFAMG